MHHSSHFVSYLILCKSWIAKSLNVQIILKKFARKKRHHDKRRVNTY